MLSIGVADPLTGEYVEAWLTETAPTEPITGFRLRCGRWLHRKQRYCNRVLFESRWVNDPDRVLEGIPINGSRSRSHLRVVVDDSGRIAALGCKCGAVWKADLRALVNALVGHPGWKRPSGGWVDLLTTELV